MLKAGSWLFLLVAFLTVVQFCSAQDSHVPVPPAVQNSQGLQVGAGRPNPTANGLGAMPGVPDADEVQKQQALAANLQRQIDIRRDTEKMLQLTQELKDELQKADHVLSLEAIKKAEQIEKLAKSVKSKMKQTF
jgi:hypothetical protein